MKKALILIPILALFLLAACGQTAPAESAAPAVTPLPAAAETPVPVETHNEWLEEIPWAQPWACLILGACELEPEVGKAGLHTLLYAYDWQLTDTPGKWEKPVGFAREGSIYPAEGEGLYFWLTPEGEIYWNGSLYAPLGEDLWENWTALCQTGEYLYGPPRLTLASGETKAAAFTDGSYSWTHTDRLGHVYPVISDGFRDFRETDWFSLEVIEVLSAEGEVSLSFAGPEPEETQLYLFSPLGDLSLDLRDGRFTPLAGRNAYALSCTWEKREQGGCGRVLFILLIDAPEDLAPAGTEIEGLRLTVTGADTWGCAYTLENGTTRPFSPEDMDLLRRNSAGTWEWVKPIRPETGTDARTVQQGQSRAGAWDWSYVCGPLEPGEYCLRLRGSLGFASARKEPAVLLGTFTLTGAEPDYPGPLTLCDTPEGLETSLEALSPHRWVQTLRFRGLHWAVEGDYSLFRLTETGELRYIPPAYCRRGRPIGLTLIQRDYAVDLAARYGALEAGTYVLRRRVLRYTPEEAEAWATYESWLEVPEERLEYLDAVFTLPDPLSAVPLAVSSTENSFFAGGYNGEGSVFPVSFQGSEFSPWAAWLRMEGLDFGQAIRSEEYDLYFQFEGEWFPLARTRPYPVDSRAFCHLPSGESAELYVNLSGPYGELPPGTYRLIFTSTVYTEDLEKAPSVGGPLVCPFRILEDGTGVLEEMTTEAS